MCYTGKCPYEKINGYNGGECTLNKCKYKKEEEVKMVETKTVDIRRED